jgi:hypothetical protein
MNDRERIAWESMKAWQEARDKADFGSKQWEEFDREFKRWERQYYRVRD